MYFDEHFCQHLNEVNDQGSIICTDCGLFLSNVFVHSFKEIHKEPYNENDYILEILSRLQMPEFFKHDITYNLQKIDIKDRKKERAKAFVIYKTLNSLNCGISIKDISAVTGFTDNQIYNYQTSNDSIILDPINHLEKYCILLNLPKNSYAVIKETIKVQNSGHNPITILATAIYNYCKSYKIKISMQKIANVLNISCVSIQRYLKFLKNES